MPKPNIIKCSMCLSGLHRQVKIARHTSALGQILKEIVDPHIAWDNDEKFVLTGFERRWGGGHLVDYAQSRLCMIGWDEG